MSSTKISVTKVGLRKMIDKAWGARIKDAEEKVRLANDDVAHLERLEDWRTREQARVKALANRIRSGKVQDAELSSFSVSSAPERGTSWGRRRNHEVVESLSSQYDKAIARFEAISWPPNGEREFTEAQITNLFGA